MKALQKAEMKVVIRPYKSEDRESIRHICCETGFSGSPVDPLFSDRELFADYLTRYYTDWEPEHIFVAEDEGRVIGYLLGCAYWRRHQWVQTWIMAASVIPRGLWRLLTGRYDANSRKFLAWCLFNAGRETPSAPKRCAHMHFNLLPDYRAGGVGARLLAAYVKVLKQKGVKRVYGQMQTTDDRRTERVFNKYGFQTYDRRKITKFEPFHNETVYVSTVVREIE